MPSRVSSSRVGACGVKSEPATTTSTLLVTDSLVPRSVAVTVILWVPTLAYVCLKRRNPSVRECSGSDV